MEYYLRDCVMSDEVRSSMNELKEFRYFLINKGLSRKIQEFEACLIDSLKEKEDEESDNNDEMVQDTLKTNIVTMKDIATQDTTENKKKKMTRKQSERDNDIQTNHDI